MKMMAILKIKAKEKRTKGNFGILILKMISKQTPKNNAALITESEIIVKGNDMKNKRKT